MRTKFTVVVTQTVEVTLDESKFTPDFMKEFYDQFYRYDEIDEHAGHIAQLAAREVYSFNSPREFVEGYGPIGDFGISARVTSLETEVERS